MYNTKPFTMFRRALALSMAMCVFAASLPANAQSFEDLEGGMYKDAVTYLSNKNIVQGYRDGTVRPANPINRAEAVKILVESQSELSQRVADIEDRLPPIPLFADIDQQAWYAPYVEVAFENNMIGGYADGTFRPSRPVTTAEAIALTMRLYGLASNDQAAIESPLINNQNDEWFTGSVNATIQRNLLNERGRLTLADSIRRGQFFDIVYRTMYTTELGLNAFPSEGTLAEQPITQPVAPARTFHPEQVPRATFNLPQPPTSTISAGQRSSVRIQQQAQTVNHPYASEKHFSITMPSLGITDLTITHPVDPFTSNGVLAPLELGVGHLFSYPGTDGKIMVYGHSSGYAWDVSEFTKIFRRVNELNPGDRIYVTYADKLYTYEVTKEQTVDASDTSPFNDSGTGEELILYTCWPPDSIAQRYLVHARPVEEIALR